MIKALTDEQKKFAAENHGMIFAFLHDAGLPVDEFYGAAAIGFLRAVNKYYERSDLLCYSFSTIAWKNMRSESSNYQKRLRRIQKADAELCDSISSAKYSLWRGSRSWQSEIAIYLETQRLLHEIASALPDKQAQAVVLKAKGYNLNEIAKIMRMRNYEVRKLIETAYAAVLQILF